MFDNGWDDGSTLRQRMNAAFDEVVTISALTDDAAARAIAGRRIDILVNLNGWFGLGRTGVFVRRPAPLQVNFLGFPGHAGRDYIDLIVADAHVIPAGEEGAYVERVVRLPHSYQPNDRQRAIGAAPRAPSLGLPEDAFVFACFNNTYKITPATFASLDAHPGGRRRQRAVAAAGQRRRHAQPARRRGGARRRCRTACTSRRASASTSTSRATRAPTCSSTRCPTTRTPPPATRCGPACRCCRAAARRSPAASARACCMRWTWPTSCWWTTPRPTSRARSRSRATAPASRACASAWRRRARRRRCSTRRPTARALEAALRGDAGGLGLARGLRAATAPPASSPCATSPSPPPPASSVASSTSSSCAEYITSIARRDTRRTRASAPPGQATANAATSRPVTCSCDSMRTGASDGTARSARVIHSPAIAWRVISSVSRNSWRMRCLEPGGRQLHRRRRRPALEQLVLAHHQPHAQLGQHRVLVRVVAVERRRRQARRARRSGWSTAARCRPRPAGWRRRPGCARRSRARASASERASGPAPRRSAAGGVASAEALDLRGMGRVGGWLGGQCIHGGQDRRRSIQ